jgi:hypothetical protein
VNVLSTRVVLRERSLAEVFDLAFRFVIARGGKRYLKLWLLSCLPPFLACLEWRRHDMEWGWVWTFACLGFVVAQIPFTLAASRLLLDDDLSLRSLVKAWLPRIPGQVLMHALAAVAFASAGWLIFTIPFLAARCLFLPEITLLEGSNMLRAYERGTRITRQRLSQTLEACLLLLAVWAAFILGAEVTGRAVQMDLLSLPAPTDALVDGGSWFALAGFFAAVPFLATARFLVYIDGRTRREAWDVQLRFTELAKSPRGAT